MIHINVLDLGRKEYMEVLELQRKLQQLRIEDKIGNVLILVEHEPVLTMGMQGKLSNILCPQSELEKQGIKTVKVERGGDVTYHGPGQLVGYPIFDLSDFGRDTHVFVSKLQAVISSLLKNEYGLIAEGRLDKYTGVWIDSKKIAAIGINIRKWVSMHGFAFNINTNLDHFKWIIPCGLQDAWVTSLKEQIGQEVDLKIVSERIKYYFSQVFDVVVRDIELDEIDINI